MNMTKLMEDILAGKVRIEFGNKDHYEAIKRYEAEKKNIDRKATQMKRKINKKRGDYSR